MSLSKQENQKNQFKSEKISLNQKKSEKPPPPEKAGKHEKPVFLARRKIRKNQFKSEKISLANPYVSLGFLTSEKIRKISFANPYVSLGFLTCGHKIPIENHGNQKNQFKSEKISLNQKKSV